MKRLVSALLVVLLVITVLPLSLFGCQDNNESSAPDTQQSSAADNSADESVPADESTPADESAPADESNPAEESKPNEESKPDEESKTPEVSEDDDQMKNATNVALNKPYTKSTLHPNDGAPSYPDEGNKSMTDGKTAPAGSSYSHAAFMGFNKSHKDYTSRGYSYITVDLGGVYLVDKFVAHVGSAYYDDVGINAPQYVEVHISNDNENWYKVGRAENVDSTEVNVVEATVTLDKALTAKYVQYRFVGHTNWIFVCEVEAFGVETDKAQAYPEQKPVESYLFIGNSATYFFDIPTKFMYIAESVGKEIDVTYCTVGGAYLSEFADPNDETHGVALRKQLAAKKFDNIVLQDNGNCDYSDSKPAMDKLVPMLRETGATLHLYQRYSSNTDPAKRLDSAYRHEVNYRQLAKDFNIPLVAQGADAFLICSEKYPELVIYHTDNSHHSDLGAYLIACVLAMTYLDIDLDDVTYTAGYDATTVAKIKECARIACEQGYDYPQDK